MKKLQKKNNNINRLWRMIADRQFLAFVLLLFYPFNSSIMDKLFGGAVFQLVLFAIGIALLAPDLKKRISKRTLFVCVLVMVIGSILLTWNSIFDTTLHNAFQFLIRMLYFALIPFLLCININYNSLKRVITIYSIEHIIGTAIPVFFPEFYEKNIVSFLCSGTYRCHTRTALFYGNNAGLTTNYTTNGCYMAIASIHFASLYMKGRRKRYGLLTALSIIALLVIGKRAHFLFVLFALLVGYITYSRKASGGVIGYIKKNIKICLILAIAIPGVILISWNIPQVNTTINRIMETSQESDISNGRTSLYSLAIREWGDSPIIGSGWGHYISTSHKEFGWSAGVDYIHSHNDFLELLCDCGVIGFTVYAIMLLLLIIVSYKQHISGKNDPFAFMYILFYVIYGFTGTPLYLISTFSTMVLSVVMLGEKE